MKKDVLPELNGKDYIEQLNENYDIRFCRIDEYDELMEFIDTYWRKDHIFVHSKELFDFQHLNLEENRYDFIVARNKESGEIHSTFGFITTKHFDNDIKDIVIWPAIWKTRDDIKVKGLGVSLFYYLKEHINIDSISPLGISDIALSIYNHWNFETGQAKHFVLPNQSINEFYLTDNLDKIEKISFEDDSLVLKEIGEKEYEEIDINEEVFSNLNKYKSKKYYAKRFFNHPIYTYVMYAISDNQHTKAIIIARVCGHEGHNCLRIVDYVGDISYLKTVSKQLYDLMVENNYEYIDLIEVGSNENAIKEAHFVDKKDVDGLVVPNFFEPFEKKNLDLNYALKTVSDYKAEFFKADSDQDRPNVLPKE